MTKFLEDKVAIVTGAGRGIGRGHAMLLAEKGAKVVVNDPGVHFDGTGETKGPADDVVAEIKAAGGEAIANYESVADFQGAKKIVDCAIQNYGKLNILVNNAGILRDRMIFNMAEEEWDAVIAVHLKGTFNCMRHACGYWREEFKAGRNHKGKIINTTSDSGLLGNAGQCNYGAAKAGIAALTIVVAEEMSRSGVCCNAVAPGGRTRMTTDAMPAQGALMAKPPEGEFDMFSPDNVAPVVVFLASDEADGISGEVFRSFGDRIWFLRGWHTVESRGHGKSRWTPEELGPAIKEMMQKAPPKENMTAAFGELLT
ncbi:MAG: SDR family oxidoreductase [Chloroflexota bacterium]|nr:SDR family oxidoreductase [Chloroflexota bacterium]